MTDPWSLLIVAGTYALILFLVLLIPFWRGIQTASQEKKAFITLIDLLQEKMDAKTARDILESTDLRKELLESPEGIPGFGRTLMTLGIVVIVGIAIFHLLVSSTLPIETGFLFPAPNTPQSLNQTLALSRDLISLKAQELSIVNNIVTILGGAVSAIIGFYFGTKAAEKPEEEKSSKQIEKAIRTISRRLQSERQRTKP